MPRAATTTRKEEAEAPTAPEPREPSPRPLGRVASEVEAMRTCRDGSPRVVITGINRRSEDMKGLYFARAMRVRSPWLTVIFTAALWPVKLHQCSLGILERFLSKPVAMVQLECTVRELLAAPRPA